MTEPGGRRAAAASALGYMLASALAFSLMSLFVKAVGKRLPSQEIVVVRAIVSLVLSAAILARARVPFGGTRKGLLVLRGVLGFCALSCFFHAITRLPLGAVTVIHYLHPLFAALIGALVLRERIDWRLAAALALGLAGVAIVARADRLFSGGAIALDPGAVAIAVAGSLFGAAAVVTVRRLAATEHPLVIVFYFPLVAVPLSLPALAADALWPTPAEWVLLVGVGVATQVGQVMLTHGLRHETAGRATAISYVQVIFAAAWGTLFFGEIPEPSFALGAALILAAVLLIARRRGTTPPAGGAR